MSMCTEMNEKNYINIVLTGSNSYVIPMGVLMYSIVRNLSPERSARFFLFVSGWGAEEEEQIRKVSPCEIVILHTEEHLHHFSGIDTKESKLDYIDSLATYYRLLIPEVLPEEVERAFYVDADMIVDGNLAELYDSMPEDKLLAAVPELVANVQRETVLAHVTQWDEFEKYNRQPEKYPYVNAGFFLMNVKMARQLRLFDELMDFLRRHPNPPYCDQDTLNAVCGQKHSDKMLYLPLHWNVFCDTPYAVDWCFNGRDSIATMRRAWEHPAGYHYGGRNKPWLNKEIHQHWNVWFNYFRFSPFRDADLPVYHCAKQEAPAALPERRIEVLATQYAVLRRRYRYYKIMALLTWGRRRRHYKAKRRAHRYALREIRRFWAEGRREWEL